MCIISTAQQARPKVIGHRELWGATQQWSQQNNAQSQQGEMLLQHSTWGTGRDFKKISCYFSYIKSSCFNDITAPHNSTTAGQRNISKVLITLTHSARKHSHVFSTHPASPVDQVIQLGDDILPLAAGYRCWFGCCHCCALLSDWNQTAT